MKKDFSHLDRFRTTDGEFASPIGATYGAFAIPHETNKGEGFLLIVDDGSGPEQSGWEHVSVRCIIAHKPPMSRCPTWYEMDWIKRLFWKDDEIVVQYHVNDGRKVNNNTAVLHLWRPTADVFPMPLKEYV